MKQVIQLDTNGYYVGTTFADESPLEPGVYHLPSNCVDTSIPETQNGKVAKWENGWIYEDVEISGDSQPVELTYEQKRAKEYPPITDYLDGVVKGNQTQINKYIADCQAIKDKYPKT